ncbi:TIR domain-containing protein [Flavobacterium sp. AG291]|uniref:TIR domain-containing protein n=1 Tax=Flavobacterium sp. AG291 TaxID=2184000 RepID=UPI000E0C1E26|nr:nucleotide-binding protein [Flavobacterium sp. AG291]RDI07983.1 putative nucleotide-binding protein [Flavobacterium sp. AG291]
MEKSKKYKNVYFSADVIKPIIEDKVKFPGGKNSYRLRRNEESWEFDDIREFFSDYRKPHDSSTIRKSDSNITITINYTKDIDTTVSVVAKSRGEIEEIFEIFEDNHASSIVPVSITKAPVIFIGHGGSSQWRDLKDHLTDKHDYKIEAYETGARAGHTIRDILDDMASKSSFAILVMTGEDVGTDGKLKARPNVIHEIGLFQGRLGFSKAIVLLESGTEEFSNLYGIQQLRFSKGNIKETFGDVLATLKREFNN